MDLFRIERFGAECLDEEDVKAKEMHLHKLIEQRRKKRKSNISEEDETKTLKKKKKKKLADDTEECKQEIVVKEKKLKKKKKKQSDDEEDESEVEKQKLEKKKKSKTKVDKSIENALENSEDESSILREDSTDKRSKKKENSLEGVEIEEINEQIEEENEEKHNNDDLQQEPEKEHSFPILGKQVHRSKGPVKRNLPRWLAEPKIISSRTDTHNEHKIEELDFLSCNTIKNLERMGVKHLFPVQSHVVPTVMDMFKNKKPCFPCRDICVQSPTGSGKTLSYVMPVIEAMSKNIIRDLQCLVVLPTKDLAAQVKVTFDQCVVGTNLKVGLVAGVKSFAKEQESIITARPTGFHTLIDILVCSPGRLVDHLKLTPGFSLAHLKYMVIDEADRLLSDSYANWLALSMKSVQADSSHKIFPLTPAKFSKPFQHVQKFLFSATLTENPEKIATLELFNPILFLSQSSRKKKDDDQDVEGEEQPPEDQEVNLKTYVVPDQLKERMMVVEAHQKPLALLYLMKNEDHQCALCFTNSIESTHRLFLLLQRFKDIKVAEFSSKLNETQRKGILRDFRQQKVNLLIATDSMSRGMDIRNVDLVVNYDAPNNAKTYVHRVGRTARGGEEGEAVTILQGKEVFHFKKMHQSLDTARPIKKIRINEQAFEEFEDDYELALRDLKTKVQSEKKKI
ncbi:ATP-dependent RNA helicase DDX51-like isoform X1 [Clytia hemisphaerica]|uniref:ATP-dependent RNA helicase n=1 Tax=Clytia hemisphaerica TaxID=252671 RepID=A0A7M5VCJ8_9CNID|eukprot:TCONS_00065301-protein